VPALLAAVRIRIPIAVPEEAVPWIVGAFLLLCVVVAFVLTARLWKEWGLAAWAVIAVGGAAATVLRNAGRLGVDGVAGTLVYNVVSAAVLVLAGLLFWGVRRRVDITGALLAAVAYGVAGPPLSLFASGVAIGAPRPVGALFSSGLALAAAAATAGLMVALAIAVARVEPLWRAVFAGLAAGTAIGEGLRLAVLGLFPRFTVARPAAAVAWAVVEGLILGALAAAALRTLKRERRDEGSIPGSSRPSPGGNMRVKIRCLAAVTVLAAVPPAAKSAPLRVAIRAGSSAPLADGDRKAREQETELAMKRAEDERKTVHKAVESAHGKRTDRWPAEAKARFDTAWQAELMARLAHHAVKTDAKHLAASASQVATVFQGAVQKNTAVALSESAEGADLVVEVLARRAKSSFPAAAWMLYLKITPGPAVPADRLAGTSFGEVRGKDAYLGQILGMQKLAGFISTAHPFSAAEPYWIVEVYQQGTSYFAPAETAAEAIAAFATGMTEQAPVAEAR
jgi:hypothetical protein